ncbi:membrane protein [Pseudoalteromonas luteoviolacea]|nr:membrane protein [Pseudoalteromonas luteoviolacea]
MKLKMLSIVVAMATVSSLQASEIEEGVYLGVFGDYYDASWENIRGVGNGGVGIDNSTGWGAELGYRFNKYWSARIEYADLDFDLEGAGSGSVDGDRLGIDGLYHFDGGPFYALAGLKSIDVFDSNLFANAGVGYRHHFTENFAANFETAIYQGLERGYTDVGAKLGINYMFGGSKSSPKKVEPAPQPAPQPAVVAAPKDSDKDGVLDKNDRCANTPMSDAVDSMGCSLYEDIEITVSLLVRFPNNNSQVSQQYLNDISAVVEFLNAHPETTVVLEGHTSSLGKADYNMWLSKKRADAVSKQLIKKGIDASRISTVGYGEERLLDSSNTQEAHTVNRRVEAKVISAERVKVKR